jgi:hypothetical protein
MAEGSPSTGQGRVYNGPVRCQTPDRAERTAYGFLRAKRRPDQVASIAATLKSTKPRSMP